MSRCRSCNSTLTREECNSIIYNDKRNNRIFYEDLCIACKTASLTLYDYLKDKEYQFGNLENIDFYLTE